MAFEVRLARPEELEAAGRVVVAAYDQGGFLAQAEDGYVDKLGATAARATDAELVVAVEDDRVLGCVTFCPYGSPWGEIAQPHEGEFRMLAVHPSAVGRGLGRALAQHCLDRSRALGYTDVVISSLPTMTAAHGMYRELGFARAEDRDWEPVPGVVLWAFTLAL